VLRTLYGKLALALVVIMLGIGLTYAILSLAAARHHLAAVSQSFNRDLAGNLVRDRSLVRQGVVDAAALKQTFHHYMEINPSIEIYLLDQDGNILAFSAEPGRVVRTSVSLEPIRAFLGGDETYPLLGDDPRSLGRQKVFSVTPVPSVEGGIGYLYVVLRGELLEQVEEAFQESYYLRLGLWAAAVSLAFGLATGLLIFWAMTRRLRRLTGRMRRFRAAESAPMLPINAPATDELEELQTTFDSMSGRIAKQIEELRAKDAARREMVAHVSHDLRTPLASLNGYLETLQIKDDSLTPPERKAFLDVALNQGRRLAALIDDLFELAKLEAVDTEPQMEPFSLADLVQDVIQKYGLRAERNRVDLDARIPGSIPLARADIGLMERVLDNIIGNALDHTPEGGHVQIGLHQEDGRIAVDISDTGCGIPEKDLSRVFDRFYRGRDAHRGDHHAGLGLAIAKRILDLHRADISVRSEPGQGTTFSFALPVAATET
jgi:signal transduction histidine kinase